MWKVQNEPKTRQGPQRRASDPGAARGRGREEGRGEGEGEEGRREGGGEEGRGRGEEERGGGSWHRAGTDWHGPLPAAGPTAARRHMGAPQALSDSRARAARSRCHRQVHRRQIKTFPWKEASRGGRRPGARNEQPADEGRQGRLRGKLPSHCGLQRAELGAVLSPTSYPLHHPVTPVLPTARETPGGWGTARKAAPCPRGSHEDHGQTDGQTDGVAAGRVGRSPWGQLRHKPAPQPREPRSPCPPARHPAVPAGPRRPPPEAPKHRDLTLPPRSQGAAPRGPINH